MDEYREFLKMLKSYQQSIQYLHRHCIGAEFFSTHEVTNEIYDFLADNIDEMCEVGMTFGVDEPSMAESIESYPEISKKFRNSFDTETEAKRMLNDLVTEIARIQDVPADVKNKLEEHQLKNRHMADFKLKGALS